MSPTAASRPHPLRREGGSREREILALTPSTTPAEVNTVLLPAGPLGLAFHQLDGRTGTSVFGASDSPYLPSNTSTMLPDGSEVLSVDGVPVTGMDTAKLTNLLRQLAQNPRVLQVRSPVMNRPSSAQLQVHPGQSVRGPAVPTDALALTPASNVGAGMV